MLMKLKRDRLLLSFDLYDKLNVIYLPNAYIEKTQKEMLAFSYDSFPDNFLDENEEVMDKDTVLKEFSYTSIQVTYVLNKPEDIEDFRMLGNQILKDKRLGYYKIEASSDQFDSIAGPIKGMAKISHIVLIVSVIASIFIITLATILFLRDRKHELRDILVSWREAIQRCRTNCRGSNVSSIGSDDVIRIFW